MQSTVGDTREKEFVQVPGLFRTWDLQHAIEPGGEYFISDAGATSEGTALFTVYRRPGAAGGGQ